MGRYPARGAADGLLNNHAQLSRAIAGPHPGKLAAERHAGGQRPGDDPDGERYRALRQRVRAIVRREVRGPDAAIDDGCQTAWTRLLEHHVADTAALAWLVKAANREAWRITARDRREQPLDDRVGHADDRAADAAASAQLEQREPLAALAALPTRQRQLLWLHALGFNYREIAQLTLQSARTVERQLLRGRRAARALASGARS